MGGDARSVFRNSAASMAGQMANLLVGLVSGVYVARTLGREQFGMLNWASGLCTVVVPLANLGVDTVVTRGVARKRERVSDYLFSALLIKSLFSPLAYLGILIYLWSRGYLGLQLTVGYLICASVVISSVNFTCRAVLTGLERQDLSALLNVVVNVLRAGTVIFLVYQGYNVVAVACVTVCSQVLVTIADLVAISRLSPLMWRPSTATIRHLLAIGMTFFANSIFLKLFDRADYIMLDLFKDVGAVGIYGAAYRVIDIITLVSYSCSLAMFPMMSRRVHGPQDDYARVLQQSTKFLFTLGLPLCIGVFLLSNQLMIGLYSSQYAASGVCLSILIWSRIAAFALSPGQHSVAARNAQITLLPPVIARAAINIGLNLYLVPRYSYIGACIAMVVTENIYYLLTYLIAFRGAERFNPVRLLGKTVLATCIMAAAMLFLRPFGILAATAGAVIVYPLAILKLGVIDKEDKILLRSLITRSGN